MGGRTGTSWRKGQSGNPAGARNQSTKVEALLEKGTLPALRQIERIATKGEVKVRRKNPKTGDREWQYLDVSPKEVRAAADSLLDRSLGKPTQMVVSIGETPQQRALAALLTLYGAPAGLVEGEARPALSAGHPGAIAGDGDDEDGDTDEAA